MKTELTQALVEARELAQQRGWEHTAAVTDTLLSSQTEGALLLAISAGIEVGGLPRWIFEAAPTLQIQKAEIETLAADPLPALTAERVIALFECGRLMTSEAVDAVTSACFSRPPESYVIVLRGADKLENADELELVERGVYRLLVPEPKGDWNRQDLLTFGCYLWSDSTPPEFLEARLRRDREALSRWLARPVYYGDELAAQQALYVLDQADAEVSQAPAPPADPALSVERIYAVLSDLTELRRRLLVRLDAEVPSIERQLTASLQTLEQNLLDGARAYLAARLPHFDPSRDEARLKTVISEYIAEAANRWQSQAERVLMSRSDEIQADIDAILHSIDWTVVNAVARQNGAMRDYPGALLDDILQGSGFHVLRDGAATPHDAFAAGRQKNASTAIFSVVAAAAVARVAVFLGLGPVGLVAAGATVVVQALKYKEDSLRLCDELAHNVIQQTFRNAVSAIQQQTREALKPLRTRLIERFKELEEMLEGALGAMQGAVTLPLSEHPDRQVIAAIRQRVIALSEEDGDTVE